MVQWVWKNIHVYLSLLIAAQRSHTVEVGIPLRLNKEQWRCWGSLSEKDNSTTSYCAPLPTHADTLLQLSLEAGRYLCSRVKSLFSYLCVRNSGVLLNSFPISAHKKK